MTQSLEQSIFRVLDADGETTGTGFLVSESLAVTCAHVVEMAQVEPGSVVRVRFECDENGDSLPALVLPESWSAASSKDIAFLRLAFIPEEARPVRLAYARRSDGHTYEAVGYPLQKVTRYRTVRDTVVTLEKGVDGRGWLLQLRGEAVTNGMSGGPVLDLDLERVVGMITRGYEEKYTQLIYATPVEELITLYPDLPADDPDTLAAADGNARPAAAPKEALPPTGRLAEPGLLPLGSRMPYPRNRVFTGREADLLALADGLVYALEPGKIGITQPQAAAGLGGIGKTQLAVEFCYRYGRYFEGVHWINSANPNELNAEIADCGLQMGLPNWPEQQTAQVEATLRAWAAAPNRLVVFDNLEEPEALRLLLPRLEGLRLLITARNPHWPAEFGVQVRRLDVLAPAECRALLRRLAERLEEADDAELDELAAYLGHLALAVDLAGRYLEVRGSCAVPAYLSELRGAGSALAHASQKGFSKASPTGHSPSLDATFALSWRQLTGKGKAKRLARRVFQAAGYCAPNTPIPEDLLWRTVKAEGVERADFDFALRRLSELGLVSSTPQGAVLHPLLAQYARVLDDPQHAVLVKVCNALAGMTNEANHTALPTQFLPLLAHVEEAAPTAETAAVEKAGTLWNNLGYHKKVVADYPRARACYERALRIGERVYGTEHPDVATMVNNLGGVLNDLGDLAGAKACFDRALRIGEQVYGTEHPTVAILVNNLGYVLQDLGDLAGAKACFERALRIDEQVYGTEQPTVAIRVNNLGRVLQDLGDQAGAKACFERALRIGEQVYGTEHPDVATMVNNLGRVLKDLGDLAGAKACYERALRIGEQVYGTEHPQVALYVNNLGRVLKDLGDQAGAKACYERALRIDEQVYGTEHPRVAIRVSNLGSLLYQMGDLAGAKACFDRALAIRKIFLPENHPAIKRAQNNLDIVEKELRAKKGPM